MLGILGIILGLGIYQPACYTAVKKFTTKENSAMGYAMLFALMNLGGFLPGLLSPPIRRSFGILGVYWVYVGLTIVGILIVAIILTKKTINSAIQEAHPEEDKEIGAENDADMPQDMKGKIRYYLKNIPLRDAS